MAEEGVLSAELDTGRDEEVSTYEPSLKEWAIAERVTTDFGVFKRALDDKRKQWIDFFQHYYNVRQHKRRAGEANTPVPLAPETIDTVWADIMGKLFSPDGLRVDTLGREQLDQGHARWFTIQGLLCRAVGNSACATACIRSVHRAADSYTASAAGHAGL
jgi:hypothetical protein